MHPILQVNKQNMLEQAVDTGGCHVSLGANYVVFMFWHAIHWWQSTQQHVGLGECLHARAMGTIRSLPREEMILASKNEIFGQNQVKPFLLFSQLHKRVYQERTLKNNDNNKREVFYIQVNLYFCHKLCNGKRHFQYETEPRIPVTLPPSHTILTGHCSIVQSYNYFLWRVFCLFSHTHIQFPGTTFAQTRSKTSLQGTWLWTMVFVALYRVFASQKTTTKKTFYWKSSHKHFDS